MSIQIVLKRPIAVAGAQTDTLSMREPIVEDMTVIELRGGSDAQKEKNLMSMLCGIEPTALEGMLLSDYRKLQATYNGFFD